MSEPAHNRYDDVAYPTKAYSYAHVDRLWTIAHLFGRKPAQPDRARVLELGCGSGGHLIPMAASMPEAKFVGFDLTLGAVEEARSVIAAAGLSNIEVYQRDILDLPRDMGTFDYIVVHGVYSWVPAPVRTALLEACKRHLAPEGVAYISYNTYPGWHLRGVVRDIMRVHGETFADPIEQVEQGLAMARLIAQHLALAGQLYGTMLAQEVAQIGGHTNAYYFHDFLAPVNDPVLFRDFVAAARAQDLAYLGEVSLGDMMPTGIPDELKEKLNAVTADFEALQQQYDLVRANAFRRSLLVHPRGPIERSLDESSLRGTYVALSGTPEEGQVDLSSDEQAIFRTRQDVEVKVGGRLSKAAMMYLFSQLPGEVAFDELCEKARAWAGLGPEADADLDELGGALLHGFRVGLVDLGPRHRGAPESMPERPLALPLVRGMAGRGVELVPNLRNEVVHLARMDRVLLHLCDGTRTHDELLEGLVAAVKEGDLEVKVDGVATQDAKVIAESMEIATPQRLRRLYEASLLVDERRFGQG
jgi:SAM-dependent methyltransferase